MEGIDIASRWKRLFAFSVDNLITIAIVVGITASSGKVEENRRVIYGNRLGHDLVFDFIRPSNPNGLGIIFVNSGSWKSDPDDINLIYFKSLLRRGYSIFAISHLSQPEANVPQIFADIVRGVKFIRQHAAEYGVSPNRLGATGGSAGGHLSLLLATRGHEFSGESRNLIEAVAVFYPPTDLLNLGSSTENPGNGGPPLHFRNVFGIAPDNMEDWKRVGRRLSPIYHLSRNTPPVLIIHGNADTLVPIEQSEWFVDRAQDQGVKIKLIQKQGKRHGWLTLLLDIEHFSRWFDLHLQQKGFSLNGQLPIILSLLYLAVQYLLLAARGQTIGKLLLKIRIVDGDHLSKVKFVQVVLVRELLTKLHILGWTSSLTYLFTGFHLYLLYCLILVVMVVSGFSIFVNVNNRCLHDLIARTRVIEASGNLI